MQAYAPNRPIYRDRQDAGRVLAQSLAEFRNQARVLVMALPRGGVPVGFEVAQDLQAPLDVLIVRKLGAPGQEELAMGAIASGGAQVINPEVVRGLRISRQQLMAVVTHEQGELERRERLYRGQRPELIAAGKVVLLVDDGLATGSSMLVAVESVRALQPARIVVAVPVAPRETVREFRRRNIEIVCPATPEPFFGVGAWYEDFSQTSDEEVRHYLEIGSQVL